MTKHKVKRTAELAEVAVATNVERLLARHRITTGQVPSAEILPPSPLKEDHSEEADQDKESSPWAKRHKRIAEEAKAAGMEPMDYVYLKREAERKDAKSRAFLEMIVHRPFSDNYEKEFVPGPYRPPQPTSYEIEMTEQAERARKRAANQKTLIGALVLILLIVGRIGYLNNWGEKIIGAATRFGETSTVGDAEQQEVAFTANLADKPIAPARQSYYLRLHPIPPSFKRNQVFLSYTREEQSHKARQVFLATRTQIDGEGVSQEFKLPIPPHPELSSKVVKVNMTGEILSHTSEEELIPQQSGGTLKTPVIVVER